MPVFNASDPHLPPIPDSRKGPEARAWASTAVAMAGQDPFLTDARRRLLVTWTLEEDWPEGLRALAEQESGQFVAWTHAVLSDTPLGQAAALGRPRMVKEVLALNPDLPQAVSVLSGMVLAVHRPKHEHASASKPGHRAAVRALKGFVDQQLPSPEALSTLTPNQVKALDNLVVVLLGHGAHLQDSRLLDRYLPSALTVDHLWNRWLLRADLQAEFGGTSLTPGWPAFHTWTFTPPSPAITAGQVAAVQTYLRAASYPAPLWRELAQHADAITTFGVHRDPDGLARWATTLAPLLADDLAPHCPVPALRTLTLEQRLRAHASTAHENATTGAASTSRRKAF